jgi:hypothetical protein
MKVVRISDGLGNQMFQYAFARKIQLLNKDNVYLDIRFLNNEDIKLRGIDSHIISNYGVRTFGLDMYNIVLPIADKKVLRKWDYVWNDRNALRIFSDISEEGLFFRRYYEEGKTELKVDCLLPAYYNGYFFNLKYYDDIRSLLLKEFTLRDKIRLPRHLGYILKNDNTIGVHIRRGDFLRVNRDISEKGYYKKALGYITNKVYNPTYLVFSDDIEWVKYNMHFGEKTVYVSDMGFRDYEELMIMKHCRHNIIANSTFSYWAGYLNINPGKIVVCPKGWKTETIPIDWVKV